MCCKKMKRPHLMWFVVLYACHESPTSPPTYHRDVAPILNAHCTTCHTEGGIAPMPLTSFEWASAYSAQIATETSLRRMPPWPPVDSCLELRGAASVSQDDIATLQRWATQGALRGSPSDYEARPPRVSPTLPATGDLTLRLDVPYFPDIESHDDYRCFILDPQLTASRELAAARITPGATNLVHHVLLYEVRSTAVSALETLEREDSEPGYSCFGGIGIPVEQGPANMGAQYNQQGLGGWAPGSDPIIFPPGTSITIQPGSRIVMQMHYASHNATEPTGDTTTVDLYFATDETRVPAQWSAVYNASFRIPADTPPSDPQATVRASMALASPNRLFGIAPHMHLLGHEIRLDVVHRDGSRECLIHIPSWDFHWQKTYWLAQPLALLGSAQNYDTLELTCTFDNTIANQPTDDHTDMPRPPRTVTWGESSADEMCLAFLYLAP